MSGTEVRVVYRLTPLEEYPVYDEECYFDDPESPTSVTICSSVDCGKITTEWISCAVDDAVPLEATR